MSKQYILQKIGFIGIIRMIPYIRGDIMTASKRVIWIDVAKAILIILMIVGHVPLHSVFRNLIYSFHMPAFILFSGYMFKPNCCDDLCRSTVRLLKSFLLPYAVFGIAYMFVADGNIKTKLMTIVTGVSFTKKIFPEAVSVGAVWFVLVLFVVRLIYLLIYKANLLFTVPCLRLRLSVLYSDGTAIGCRGVSTWRCIR